MLLIFKVLNNIIIVPKYRTYDLIFFCALSGFFVVKLFIIF